MMILARAGVPGAALWIVAQLAWGWGMAAAFFRSRRRGEHRWARIFLFLGTYWFILLINGSFDVFIEGPMGGIWFWSIFGVGLAALGLYRRDPALLDGLDVEEEESPANAPKYAGTIARRPLKAVEA
jgi:peptidoglycan/LPS O-acetylase OafA/YrhL